MLLAPLSRRIRSLRRESESQSSQDLVQLMIALALQAAPTNFLNLEISLNDLMSENENQTNGEGSVSGPTTHGNFSLNVGMALMPDSIDYDVGLHSHLSSNELALWSSHQMVESIRLWARFFAAASNLRASQVPQSWRNFITVSLLNPSSFECIKQFLGTQAWNIIVDDKAADNLISFSVPKSCPASSKLIC
jgi:hypothetical protein